MNREEYARNWSAEYSAHAHGRPTIVPDDVERMSEHTPCFRCGTRAGLPCKHRRLAA